MKIAICGPASLHLVKDLVDKGDTMPAGYVYPFAAYLARDLHARGHSVSIVTSSADAAGRGHWKGERFEVFLSPRRRARGYLMDFYRQERDYLVADIRACAPDIVHAQWTYEFAHAAVQSGFPCLVTARDAPWTIARMTWSPYRIYRAVYAHRVIPMIRDLSAISEYVAARVSASNNCRGTIRIIPNGIAARLLIDHAFVPRKGTGTKFISVSGWDRRKNVKCLLRAFGAVRVNFPSARLLLIGGGFGTGEIGQQWAARHGLETGVDFLGRLGHAEVIRRMRKEADIFVHSTLEESFCMTVLEAMAQGLPVVALPHSGAVPWLLDYGRAGILARTRKWQDLALAMGEIAADADLRAKLSTAGYQRAGSQFTLESVVDQYLKAYQEVIHSNAPTQ